MTIEELLKELHSLYYMAMEEQKDIPVERELMLREHAFLEGQASVYKKIMHLIEN